MFQSATLKLTGWYLSILMSISIIFSVCIYSIASQEVGNRLQDLQLRYEQSAANTDIATIDPQYNQFRNTQNSVANTNLFFSLAYVNVVIFLAGGIGSYALARRSLRDIESMHNAQSRFTSDASHELRTPLAVMKSEIEVILRDKKASKSDLRETLQSNLEEVDKLSRLSKVLLQLSKIDHTDISFSKVNIKVVINSVIKRLNQPKQRIVVTTSSNIPNIRANIDSIEELCLILLDNALKYSPADSVIAVAITKRSSKVCIEISNLGKGIAPDDLPHIFDRFYRADTSRTRGNQAGHGLGLALAKKIVEIHHGELSVTSAPDQETVFSVLIPTYQKTPAKSQTKEVV